MDLAFSLQEVGDLAGVTVTTVNPARPNPVQRGAKGRLLAKFQSAYAVPEIALGSFAGLHDRADHGHRLVLSVFALHDQIAMPRSVSGWSGIANPLYVGNCFLVVAILVSLLAPRLIARRAENIKRNLRNQRRKPAAAGAGRVEGVGA
jgi:hypothetical protein